jgi:hypothetical protein
MDGIIPMRTRMKMLDSVDDDYFGPRKNIMTLIVLTKQSFVSEPSWYRRKGLKQKRRISLSTGCQPERLAKPARRRSP